MPNDNSKDTRGRNFATVVYPESAPENWKEILSGYAVPCMISPLHCNDINPSGEKKKDHYHVMLCYEGKKSLETIKELVKSFGGVGCEQIQSRRGYARYLCHLDNPEKAQYVPEQVTCYGGMDYLHEIGTVLDKYKAIREMVEFCNDNCITSFAILFEYCMSERPDWFRVLCDNGTFVMKEYLKSKEWTNKCQ